MNKLMIPEWATNENHEPGTLPYSGLPNKVAATAGKIATGIRPGERTSAEEMNWWRNTISQCLKSIIAGFRTANWFPGDDSAVTETGLTYAVGMSYDEDTGILTAIYNMGGGASHNMISRDGGMNWEDGDDPDFTNMPGTNGVMDIDGDGVGRRFVCEGGADDGVYRDTDMAGAWTSSVVFGGGWVSQPVVRIASDPGSSRVLCGGSSGGLAYAIDHGYNFDGFSISGLTAAPIRELFHSKDPNNPFWIVVTDTQVAVTTSTTPESATWTVVSHGLTGILDHSQTIAYDRLQRRLVLCLTGRNIAYSNTNGLTWTTVTDALPVAPTGNGRKIAAEGQGEMVICAGDEALIFSSEDAGLTWTRRFMPVVLTPAGSSGQSFVCPAFASQRFSMIFQGTGRAAYGLGI